MKKIISSVICAAILMSMLVIAGCGSGPDSKEIDLSKYVKFSGFSGFASLSTGQDDDYDYDEDDYDSEYKKLLEEKSKLDNKDSKYEETLEKIRDNRRVDKAVDMVKFELVSGEDGKISNGDKIKVKATYDKEKLEKMNVTFKADEFTLTVSGLEEKTVVDPFDEDHMVIEYSGVDGEGKIYIKSYDGEDDLTIYYDADKNYDLSNGSTVSVTASTYSDDYVLAGSVDGSKVTKDIELNGFGTIKSDLKDVDTSQVDKIMDKKMAEKTDVVKGKESYGYYFGFSGKDNSTEFKVQSCGKLKAEKKVYAYTDDNKNVYAVVYSQTAKLKVTDPGYKSKLKKGTVKNVTVYSIAYMRNDTSVSVDNKLVEDDYYYISTSTGYASVKSAVKAIKESYSEDDYVYNYAK